MKAVVVFVVFFVALLLVVPVVNAVTVEVDTVTTKIFVGGHPQEYFALFVKGGEKLLDGACIGFETPLVIEMMRWDTLLPNYFVVATTAGIEAEFWMPFPAFRSPPTTGVDDTEGVIPSTYGLEQNYPNPFNPETTIKYQLAGKSEVSLNVYNLLGQEVATLVNTTQGAGVYSVQWNGTNRLGQKVATGVYLFQLKAGDFTMTRKMVLMK